MLSPRYPEVSPLFSLSLSWKGERSGRTDDNLRVWTSQDLSLFLLLRVFVAVSRYKQLDCSLFLGHGERGQRVQEWTAGATPRTPAPDQSDLTPLCLPGCVSGDWRTRRQCGGTARVSTWKDVLAHCEVTGRLNIFCEGSPLYTTEYLPLLFVRGPTRLKPFKYNHPQGFFSHRWSRPCDSPDFTSQILKSSTECVPGSVF